jgi:hypothetical protein
MTQVISASIQTKDPSYYSASPLRRSSSHSSYLSHASGRTTFGRPSQRGQLFEFGAEDSEEESDEYDEDVDLDQFDTSIRATSSSDADSRYSNSLASTPATTISCDTARDSDRDDTIKFPSYNDVGYFGHIEDLEDPPSPRSGPSYTAPPSNASHPGSNDASRPASPEPLRLAVDDSAVRTEPTRHVDYLSHDWSEEDIWTSWRYMIQKRNVYQNSARLENASWRTWAKTKNQLRTVSPEQLNWYVLIFP